MVYCVDIDGTLCSASEHDPDYIRSMPFNDRIKKINLLYDARHTIILHTGRHWNYLRHTVNQLEKWGVKYHSLVMGKPPADIYVDDRAIDDIAFFEGQHD